MEKTIEKAKQVLKQYFGYDQFREGQDRMIQNILEGKDALGIMPTGAGKSICYQVPALIMEGITLVISPLISLMKDQVSALNQAGIHAAFINSSLTLNQTRLALRYAKEGRYKIIYVAPERLETEEFLDFALHSPISMLTVDEAHCISQWGQDFRPSYLKIVEFILKLQKRPVVSAFTATATKEVREDIICILNLENPEVLVTGFDRKNLYFSVQSPKNKYQAVLSYIQINIQKSGIIYCSTRKNVEEVTEKLQKDGISVTKYHAGLSDKERQHNQDEFIYDQKQVMVATNAFGMGIDKSNVRYVLHYNMPKNMESYYQEAGRAGRDGAPAECILFYSGQDVVTNQYFIEMEKENEEMGEEIQQLVREKDRERLKKMTFYCFTNDCLREYMLRYFGEYGNNYCGNCFNCLTQFEETDVTEVSRDIIGCVLESRQRYGINVVIETLHGANTAKIRLYRMDKNSYYGKWKTYPIFKLRQIFNQLLLKEYLHVTEDEYAIIKVNPSAQKIWEYKEVLKMKLVKEEKRISIKEESSKIENKIPLTNREKELFKQLRELRMKIAKEEKMPPYIIFSDKTLTDMCVKLPYSKETMLMVSGVGEAKYEKYGQRFLDVIKTFSNQLENN